MRMVIFILAAALLAGCGQSAHDRKVDGIIARLDAIEQKMYKNNVDLEKDIEDVENDVSDLECVQASLQKQ